MEGVLFLDDFSNFLEVLGHDLRGVDGLGDFIFQTEYFRLEQPSGTSNWNLQIVPPTGTTKMNHQLEVDQLQFNIHNNGQLTVNNDLSFIRSFSSLRTGC